MAARSQTARRATDAYLKLIRAFPLRPIRTEEENDEAIEVIASLGRREPLEDPGERDYLHALADLVLRFEAEHYPRPPVSGPALVRCLIDMRGTTQAEVAAETGIAPSALSEMLAGKRKMATKHVQTLARDFKVSADTIIGD